MDGADWLRSQLTSFGCAACGRPYESERIRILAQRESLIFVDLGCDSCGSQATALVTIQPDDADVDETPPVTSEDVAEMHDFLADFEGDIADMFRASGPGA